jgi:uncharacterized protein YndB with AHSA1/START domain
MSATSNAATEAAERELVITRILNAPREMVWKAWTEPERQAQWLGPRGFTTLSCKMDVRPGGSFRFGMRSSEGTEHWLQGVYREVVEPERVVSTYVWTDVNGNPTRPETLLTVTFADIDGKTKLTLHQGVFESVTARDLHNGGWDTSLDCLAEYLAAA